MKYLQFPIDVEQSPFIETALFTQLSHVFIVIFSHSPVGIIQLPSINILPVLHNKHSFSVSSILLISKSYFKALTLFSLKEKLTS